MARTTTSRSRTAAFGALVLLAAATGTVGSAPAQAAATDCAAPFLPTYGTSSRGGPLAQAWPDHPVVAPDLNGPPLSTLDGVGNDRIDTDGDGRADDVAIDIVGNQQVMTITRGDGVVRVAVAGHNLGLANSYPVGDLDGDGRDEVYFLARPAGPGEDQLFILPGTTAPGRYQAADVSIRLPDQDTARIVFPVGDQVAGPGQDLAIVGRSQAFITPGSVIMAVAPGGTLAAYPEAEPLPGFPSGVLRLHDGPPTIATVEDASGGHTVVDLWDQGTVTTYLTPVALPAGGQVSAVQTPTGPYLAIGYGDRGGSTVYYWNLTDPCLVLPAAAPVDPATPPASPPVAPPARPVDGAVSLTG